MELKHQFYTYQQFVHQTINRTKVELKRDIIDVSSKPDGLSIVPKWNWNYKLWSSCRGSYWLSIVPKWNWNEQCEMLHRLTQSYQSYQSGIETAWQFWGGSWAATINRTKVELKHNMNGTVSIAEGYQSYQSGIETKQISRSNSFGSAYQSYQSGIETSKFQIRPLMRHLLSIVPKWNWNL